MTARTLPLVASTPAVSLTDALQWLVEADRDVTAYRAEYGWPDVDPRGAALDEALYHARRFAVSALAHHGIDADALGRAL